MRWNVKNGGEAGAEHSKVADSSPTMAEKGLPRFQDSELPSIKIDHFNSLRACTRTLKTQ